MNISRRAFGLLLLAVMLLAGSAGATPFAYITNQLSNTVSVIDIATNTVTGTVPVGDHPFGVAVNPAGTKVYVTNVYDSSVSVIDTTTVPGTVAGTVTVGTKPIGVAVNPAGTRVYVANSEDHTVSVIDTTTVPNTVLGTVPVGHDPYGVAVNPAGTRAYVTNYYDGTVSVIDTTTNSVTDTVIVGLGAYGVAVSPAGTRVFVVNAADSTLSVIDTTTVPNTVTDTIPVGLYPFGVAVNPAGTRVFTTDVGSYTVTVIDTTTTPIAVRETIPVGTWPIGVAVNPAGTRVYVADQGNDMVSVIDTTSVPNTVIGTVGVESSPTAFGQFIGPVQTGPVPPVAGFTGDPTSGMVPLAVQFTDTSIGTGPFTYSWDFDNDGVTDSVDQNPVFTYDSAGTYSVKLTVTGPGGSADEVKIDYIRVLTGVQSTQEIITSVNTLDLPDPIETGLNDKLNAAIQSLEKDSPRAAANQLGAFINQVDAQRGKAINPDDAIALIAQAQDIIEKTDRIH